MHGLHAGTHGYTHAYAPAHVCTIHTHMHTHNTHIRTHTCHHAHTHICMHTFIDTQAHMHTYTHRHMHMHTRTYTHTHTHTHTHIHTHTHTRTHTHTYEHQDIHLVGSPIAWYLFLSQFLRKATPNDKQCSFTSTHPLPLSATRRMTADNHNAQQPYEVSPRSGLYIDVHTTCFLPP